VFLRVQGTGDVAKAVSHVNIKKEQNKLAEHFDSSLVYIPHFPS